MAEGLETGEHNAKIEIAEKMLQDGLTLDIVAKYTGLTIEVINEINVQK